MTKQITFNDFNDEQKRAVEMAVDWYKGWQDRRHRQQVFRLAGYAGTGKTTVARTIADMCSGGAGSRVEFIAPTGKAASRLRQKGCHGARTMHQFIYNVRGEDENGEPIFVSKGALDYKPCLIGLDEGSMVGEYDLSNIERHGIPILMLGDIGQLPPVKAKQVFHADNIDVLLETIERNTGNIVRASMFVRQGKRLPFREYEDVRVRPGSCPDDELMAHLDADSQMLAAYHTTRRALNVRARQLLGHQNQMMPQVGEKLVCRFNQHDHGIMNGEQGIVIDFSDIPSHEIDEDEMPGMQYIHYESLTYPGVRRKAKFNPLCFQAGAEFDDVRNEALKMPGAWDFGYCLTIHASQGSEWKRVMMMDEWMRGVPYEQLAYTGITRAIEQLTMYREER